MPNTSITDYQIRSEEELIAEEYSLPLTPTNNSGQEVCPTTQNNGGMGVYPPRNWPEISPDQLAQVLSVTIKEDYANKIITFLSELLTYTNQDQINIMFNAPSSSGKSYIALETSSLFPTADVIKVGYASPTAFWYSYSEYDEERDAKIVNLERKLIIFLDMPYFELLEKIRSLLSHDEKEISLRITNRSKKGENRADNILVRGYPTIIFASASFKLDEQEMTRFIMLSPETSQTKVECALEEAALKVSDYDKYLTQLNSNPDRRELIKRIQAVKDANIEEIVIRDHLRLLALFKLRYPDVKARHSRDIKRVAALAKGFALLNLWSREKDGGTVYASDTDLDNAFSLWDRIYKPQELGLPPFVYDVYAKVIYPAFQEKGAGIEKKDIQKKYVQVYHNQLPDWKLRKEYIPMLEAIGLLHEEDDQIDKRKKLIIPDLDIEEAEGTQPHSPISYRPNTADNVAEDVIAGVEART